MAEIDARALRTLGVYAVPPLKLDANSIAAVTTFLRPGGGVWWIGLEARVIGPADAMSCRVDLYGGSRRSFYCDLTRSYTFLFPEALPYIDGELTVDVSINPSQKLSVKVADAKAGHELKTNVGGVCDLELIS